MSHKSLRHQGVVGNEASLHVSLADGYLTVIGPSGDILLHGPLSAGGWSAIVAAILVAAPKAAGRMREEREE